MVGINPFARRKQKLSDREVDAAVNKIRAEYDKYIVTFHKSAALKQEFERRLTNARIESRDMERFLGEEIAAVKSIFAHQSSQEKERRAEEERARLKAQKKGQPDFADRVLEKLKSRMTAYPSLKIHSEASYEIEHLYGAIRLFEQQHWPPLDHFISEHGSWVLRGEKRDFNTEIWRFVPSSEGAVPAVLEKYVLLLNHPGASLKEISFEAQQCLKEAAFLLNDILWSCQHIISRGIDGQNIEKNLDFVQNVVNDFRIRDLKNR